MPRMERSICGSCDNIPYRLKQLIIKYMENDIWCTRFFGGYVPCRWRGFVFQFSIVIFVLGEFVLFGYIFRVELTIVSIVLAFVAVVYNIIMINRHS